MLPELRYELLCFYTRNELERLQPLSQSLLNMIVAGANVLPLRPVHRVNVGDVKLQIFVKESTAGGAPLPYYEASNDDGDFTETFRRLQHTCIKCFYFGIRDSPFLRYWKAQDSASFTVVSINFALPDTTDYVLLDSIVNHLRPRTTAQINVERSSWHEDGHNDKNREYLALLARESFLNNLQTCRLFVQDEAFPPASFILGEPGYASYELDCERDCCQVSDGIDGFIQSFVRDGCANMKLESVCVGWDDPEGQPSPSLKQLNKPTKIDKPLPENYLTAWYTRHVLRVTQCEMDAVVNAKQRKRMEAYKWTFEYDVDDDDGVTRITAHILQCLVKNF